VQRAQELAGHEKMRSGADLNDDNLRISRAYLRISDHCRVLVRFRVRVADCCIQTAGESDRMWINHVIKTDQWRAAPLRILSCPRVNLPKYTCELA